MIDKIEANIKAIYNGLNANNNVVRISYVSKEELAEKKEGFVHGKMKSGKFIPEPDAEIHILYAWLSRLPFRALRVLIHEAAHRFAGVDDVSYYHAKKTREI